MVIENLSVNQRKRPQSEVVVPETHQKVLGVCWGYFKTFEFSIETCIFHRYPEDQEDHAELRSNSCFAWRISLALNKALDEAFSLHPEKIWPRRNHHVHEGKIPPNGGDKYIEICKFQWSFWHEQWKKPWVVLGYIRDYNKNYWTTISRKSKALFFLWAHHIFNGRLGLSQVLRGIACNCCWLSHVPIPLPRSHKSVLGWKWGCFVCREGPKGMGIFLKESVLVMAGSCINKNHGLEFWLVRLWFYAFLIGGKSWIGCSSLFGTLSSPSYATCFPSSLV